MSNRIEKVNSLILREISGIIAEEFNFSGAIVTVSRVEASSNLIEARVYISVYPEEKSDEAVSVLRKNIYGVQQKINKKLKMRPVPKVIFVKDAQIKEAARVEELLESLKNEEK